MITELLQGMDNLIEEKIDFSTRKYDPERAFNQMSRNEKLKVLQLYGVPQEDLRFVLNNNYKDWIDAGVDDSLGGGNFTRNALNNAIGTFLKREYQNPKFQPGGLTEKL